MQAEGHIFGPGWPSAGAKIAIEAGEAGIRYTTAAGLPVQQPWGALQMRSGGWDGAQLQLEWREGAGSFSMTIQDAAAVRGLKALAAGRAAAGTASANNGTRRLSLALIFATVALPLLLLAGLVWNHDRMAQWAVSWIPVEAEMKLGEAAFAQYRQTLKLQQGPALEMVRELGARLTAQSRYKYQFHLAEDASVNAFALPGGVVVVHTGLLRLAESAEEVAGVLAHEVQHVEQRHSLKGMAKSMGLVAAVNLYFGDLGGLASLGGDLLNLKFSRDHESEADREGLAALVRAGIRPDGMRAFFARLAAQEKLDVDFLSTHPSSAARMAELEGLLRALPAGAMQVPLLPYDHAALKAGPGAKP